MDYQDYKKFFRRFLLKDICSYLKVADVTGLEVLDLCGGGGRLSYAAEQAGAKRVVLVDKDRDMTKYYSGLVTHVYNMSVPEFLYKYELGKFDVAFCIQGINFWFGKRYIEDLTHHLKPGGLFVFNTFNTLPILEVTIQKYSIDDVSHIEVVVKEELSFGTYLHHMHVTDGYAAEVQSFRWVSPDEFLDALTPYFKVDRSSHGKSDTYVCTLKSESTI